MTFSLIVCFSPIYGRACSVLSCLWEVYFPASPLSPKGDQALSLSLKLGPRGALQVHSLAGGGSEFFLYVFIDYSGIIGE